MGFLKCILYWCSICWKLIRTPFFLKWIVRNFSNDVNLSNTCLKGKTAIVTGGSSGIGYAFSMLLASKGCRVIIACRRDATEQKECIIRATGNTEITTKYMDLSKLESVHRFARNIIDKEKKIDILVNNAGIGASSMYCTEDGLNTVMQVNYFGHVLLTYLLLDKLKASTSPRVFFISSALANIHNLTADNLNATNFNMDAENVIDNYANSKLCNILAAQEMSKEFAKYGIIVNSFDPGVIRTSIFDSSYSVNIKRKWSLQLPIECLIFLLGVESDFAAQSLLYLAATKDIESGSHYFRSKPFDKPRIMDDHKVCEQIWQKTKQFIKVKA